MTEKERNFPMIWLSNSDLFKLGGIVRANDVVSLFKRILIESPVIKDIYIYIFFFVFVCFVFCSLIRVPAFTIRSHNQTAYNRNSSVD